MREPQVGVLEPLGNDAMEMSGSRADSSSANRDSSV